MHLDPKALDAARHMAPGRTLAEAAEIADPIVAAYISSAIPGEVAELVARLNAGPDVRELEDGSGAWEMDPDETGKTMRLAAAALTALAARVEALEAGLEPFSDMAGELFARNWDASRVVIALDNPDDPNRVTAGDFFAARLLLDGKR